MSLSSGAGAGAEAAGWPGHSGWRSGGHGRWLDVGLGLLLGRGCVCRLGWRPGPGMSILVHRRVRACRGRVRDAVLVIPEWDVCVVLGLLSARSWARRRARDELVDVSGVNGSNIAEHPVHPVADRLHDAAR